MSGPSDEEGFALAEVLVAFAILALVMLAMMRAFAGTTATLRATAAGEARLELAERIVAERRAEPGLSPGRREGVEEGLAWTSVVEPVDGAEPRPGFPRLLRLVVAVGRSAGEPAQPVLATLVLAGG
ncbi:MULTISPECIES: prepilin-type N-terminal cleavage/methylation domain-containing protein [unclassified Aureimonas]|uniref:type IV pilus modification PilV family protein n=1 Tax=unclassified Aureimonas TaxID=2615206 RepID=UPI000701447C|nr:MULTISPECIES: prepilin-type N-terminal cleavage/methylation domain-containing protein [unclassified Aureimonas]KQT69879.1 hypothetical protein ASG62_01890 [Aureimonas sp. Leaf427]KQT75967.1 hypothetical protein ASG54_14330 [Aureimonas sp. Leaf460]